MFRLFRTILTLTAAFGVVSVFSVSAPVWVEQAHAACAVTAGGGTADAPASNATVVCDTTGPNPDTTGINNATGSDGVTVTLQPGAGISTSAVSDNGIALDDNIVIELQNGSSISTAGDSAEGIDVDNGAQITLRDGSSVMTTGDRSVAMQVQFDSVIVLDSGSLVSSTGNGSSGILISDRGNLTVAAGAAVTAVSDRAIFIGGGTVLVGGSVLSQDGEGILQGGRGSSGTVVINVLQGGSVVSTNGIGISLGVGNDDVTVAGTVRGGGGTAIRFEQVAATVNNRLELQPGFLIDGDVLGGLGTDTLAFGGIGTATISATDINFSGVAAGEQYRGFDIFVKEDPSTFNITGDSADVFDLPINGGTLIVQGNLPGSTMVVASGATLAGGGGVGNFTATMGSTISPGNTPGVIGTLNVAGTATFNAGSIYLVDIEAPNMADLVQAGTAQINGGTINVATLTNPDGLAPGQEYVIVNTTGGRTGFFDGINSPSAFMDFVLIHNTNQVLLRLEEINDFTSVAMTFNQTQAAMALDDLDDSADSQAIRDALLGLTAAEAKAAFEAIAGAIHSEAAVAGLGAASGFNRAMNSCSVTGTGFHSASLAAPDSGDGTAYGADLIIPDPVPEEVPADDGPLFCLTAFGGVAEVDGDGNAGGFNSDLLGLAGTVEDELPFFGAIGGFSLGYSRSGLDLQDRFQSGDIDTLHAGLYARAGAQQLENGWGMRGALSYAHHFVETSRTIAFGPINRTAEADYDGSTIAADARVHYNMEINLIPLGLDGLNETFLTPFAHVAFGHTDMGSFTETGAGALNQTGNADALNQVIASVGLELSGEYQTNRGLLRPSVSVAYEHLAGDSGATTNFFLQGSPVAFSTRGTRESRHRLRIGSYNEYIFSENASLILSADTVLSEDRRELTGRAGFKVAF